MFKTIDKNASSEIVEKKSKFIANIFYVETEEQAENYIKEINKKYFDSRHNCYAYSIFTENGIINRFSDNGEPSGTAGAPMLSILNSKELVNVLVIVTRYFRRNFTSEQEVLLEHIQLPQNLRFLKFGIIFKDLGLEASFQVSYADLQKLKYYFDKNNIKILDNIFEENVTVIFECTKEFLSKMLENQVNFNFKILNNNILKEKFIECIE